MDRFARMFAALGQPSRLAIFRLLLTAGPEGCCVEDIRHEVSLPGSTLSHHLDTLVRCALLTVRREGRFLFYAIDRVRTAELLHFLLEDCCAGLRPEKETRQ